MKLFHILFGVIGTPYYQEEHNKTIDENVKVLKIANSIYIQNSLVHRIYLT
jgi:hypothetical protein